MCINGALFNFLAEEMIEMKPDTGEAFVKELTELEKYWKAVKDNPADFTGWTYLLQYVEQEVRFYGLIICLQLKLQSSFLLPTRIFWVPLNVFKFVLI
jgi:hypothetical protein